MKSATRHLGFSVPAAPVRLGALLLAAAIWVPAPQPARAQTGGRALADAMSVYLQAAPACASSDDVAALEAQLSARLPSLNIVLERPAAVGWTVEWAPDGEDTCEIALETSVGRESTPLGPTASEDELRAAAVRLAWWMEVQPAPPRTQPAESAQTSDEVEPIVVQRERRPIRSLLERAAPEWEAPYTLSAQFGAAYYPAPGAGSSALRLFFAVPVAATFQVGIEARLGAELEFHLSGYDADYVDRTLGLMARYLAPIARDWLIDASIGLRYGLPGLEQDESAEVPAHLEGGVSNLSIATSVGLGYALTSALRLRLDVIGAVSVRQRRIISEDGQAAELGSFSVDSMLGLELSF